jgi:hypothetical protein
MRSYRAEHQEEMATATRNWRINNIDHVKASVARWKAENPERVRASDAKRGIAERVATPLWLTSDQRGAMKVLYAKARLVTKQTGVVHHVDHIVPIQGKDVCGLNVPWNMRVVAAEVNASKGYRLDPVLGAPVAFSEVVA